MNWEDDVEESEYQPSDRDSSDDNTASDPPTSASESEIESLAYLPDLSLDSESKIPDTEEFFTALPSEQREGVLPSQTVDVAQGTDKWTQDFLKLLGHRYRTHI
jgi:hypothetical protein